jgi:hypothetical protein
MPTSVRPIRGWFSGLNWWRWPFLWVLLVPVVTMPLQVERLGASEGFLAANVYENCDLAPGPGLTNTWKCPVECVLPTLMPGLLNLVAFLWLVSPRRKTRYAALVAGALGAVRVAVPALIYMALGSPISLRTQYWPGPNESAAASVILWLLSVAVLAVFPAIWLRLTGQETQD